MYYRIRNQPSVLSNELVSHSVAHWDLLALLAGKNGEPTKPLMFSGKILPQPNFGPPMPWHRRASAPAIIHSDPLSRVKYPEPSVAEARDPSYDCVFSVDGHSDDNVYTVTLECPHIDPLVMAIDNLASMQYSDPKLRPIIDYLNLGTLPNTKKDIHKHFAPFPQVLCKIIYSRLSCNTAGCPGPCCFRSHSCVP